jgi:glycosyltransferase involved in cell wall biosynthesis
MVRRLSPLGVPVIRQPMGVDHNRFRPSGPPEGSRFLMFGRVYDYLKGSTFVLEAARRLWSKRRDFRLVVTGRPFRHEAAPEVDPFLEVQPFHPHEEVPGLLRESFACLIPPLWPEPFPLVAVEAMACGRPVIGTDAGGLAELLEDGVNGLVVPPRDPGALAAAMGRLLDDRPLARRLAERGLETARTYSWKELYERAYGELFPPIC